jgi:3,4-dihydroxy 2-butanone 4-phosphate synthase / GTP cyclohydrolase II
MSNRISEVVKAFSEGQIVVVTDDGDREGEGDLVVAATFCTTNKMAFIIRHTSGIVCAPVTLTDARRLRLDPMVSVNESSHEAAFTVSIDYKPDGTTGISAEERATCCRALANPNVGAGDFARPGHIFPLIAKEGGVLFRAGHTEAAIDLCRLAKLTPVGVISELMNEDGTVMKGRQVSEFAARHNFKLLTIDDLIAFRQSREKLIERSATFAAESPIGPLTCHAYRSPFDPIYHFVYIYSDVGDGGNILTYFHRPSLGRDFFTGGSSAKAALSHFKENGSGVMVYLRDGAAGVPSVPLDPGSSSESHRNRKWREVGLGAQILKDLEVRSIRHLTSGPKDFRGLNGFGIDILATEPL